VAARTFNEYITNQRMNTQILIQLRAVWDAATEAAEALKSDAQQLKPKIPDVLDYHLYAEKCGLSPEQGAATYNYLVRHFGH
jgi:hypothetical protein